MKKIILFSLIVLPLSHVVFGCSFVKLPAFDNPINTILMNGKPAPIQRPLPTGYVFIGEVVEILKINQKPIEGEQSGAEALRIKVTGDIFSPQSASVYEVMPLSMYPDCTLRGQTGLDRFYPIGSSVRVIAVPATIFKKPTLSGGDIRLETSYRNGGILSRNDLVEKVDTTKESVFDYSSVVLKTPSTDIDKRQYSILRDLLLFELQKDLARLASAKKEHERLKVMERLVYYPEMFDVAYHRLAQAYLKNGKKREVLEKKWEERKKQIFLENKNSN